MVSIPFCGQTYSDATTNANAQESINLYPMRSPTEENPNRIIMYPSPGYSSLVDTTTISGAGAIRAMLEINDIAYVISGTKLLKLTVPNTLTVIGTLNTSVGRCSIVCNTVELIIGDGQYGYVYNLGSGAFSVISGGGWPVTGGVTNFTYQDGYILAADNNSKQVIQSDALAGGTYGALSYATVTSFADNIRAVFSDELQLYIFGPKVTEVRANAGSTPFAFQKVSGVLVQAGCVSWATIVKAGGTVIWLATDAAGKAYVAAMEGYNPKVLSTPPMNEAIERYATVADAFAYTYREADNQFYCITFPSANASWCYDLKIGMWHKRSIAGGRDLPEHYVSFNNQHIVGDSTGKLWLMSQTYSTDNSGSGLTRIRTCQHVSNDGNLLFLHELQILVEMGVGTISGQGMNPLATLEVSRDGGNTWVNMGTGSMGLIGQTRRRLIWRRLGKGFAFAFRLTITDPVRTYILGATAQITQGR